MLLAGDTRIADAQAADESDAAFFAADPAWAKVMAKAELEASRADVRQLARARRDAVQVQLDARFKEFLAGRGTLDILLESARWWRDAERSVQDSPAGQLAALERYWEITREIEEINKGRAEAGRLPYKEYMEPRYERLTAEMDLLRARSGKAKPLPLVGATPLVLGENEPGRVPVKLLAKAKFEANEADIHRLAQSRLQAAEVAIRSRVGEFLAGRGTLDIMLETGLRWLHAELAVRDDPTYRLAAYERHWELVYLIDETQVARFEAGRIPIQDRQQAHYFRLQAELWLLAALEGGKPLGLSQRALDVFTVVDPTDGRVRYAEINIEPRQIARAKLAAVHADPRQLTRARLAAATEESDARWKEFLAGRGTLDIFLGSLERRLESELALADDAASRLAAHEKHWRQLLQVEAVNQARFDTGRIPIQDHMQSRYARLDAQIRLAQARKAAGT
jgi:hypothetical protein